MPTERIPSFRSAQDLDQIKASLVRIHKQLFLFGKQECQAVGGIGSSIGWVGFCAPRVRWTLKGARM